MKLTRISSTQVRRLGVLLAIASVLLVGIRVNAISPGTPSASAVRAANLHPERHNLRDFAGSCFRPAAPFAISFVASQSRHVPPPAVPYVDAHPGGFYVNRPPPLS